MMRAVGLHDELQDSHGPPELTCWRCDRICEPLEIAKCVTCHKMYCNYCVFTIGGKPYCSRPCGEAFFFGDPSGGEDGFGDDDE